MKNFLASWFDDREDPDEPVYDPAQLGAALLVSLTAIGALYWLLWTLLVYEGGLWAKAAALVSIVFTSRTAADFGYEASPYAMGVFSGWLGNLGALLLLGVLVAALHRAYRDAEAAAKRP